MADPLNTVGGLSTAEIARAFLVPETTIAVRAHLLEMAGDLPAALLCYRTAARLTTSLP